jgi:uncharacterized membrane protein YbhN (UPF0104 family)
VSAVWSALAAIGAVIGHANIAWVTAAVAADTTMLFAQAFRWRLLLGSLRSSATLWDTLLAYSAGVFVGNVTPARAVGGDACRIALIPRPGGVPPVSAIGASVIYDRATDAAGIVFLALIGVPALRLESPFWLPLVVTLVVAGAFAARPLFRRLAARVAARHPAVIGHDMRAALAGALACSPGIWLLDITRTIFVAAAFGVRLSPFQAAAVALLRIGSAGIPVPGGIGVVDGALMAGFMWLGLPRDTAVAMAIVERAIVYGWDTAMGAVSLLLVGGVRALRQARAEPAALDIAAETTR